MPNIRTVNIDGERYNIQGFTVCNMPSDAEFTPEVELGCVYIGEMINGGTLHIKGDPRQEYGISRMIIKNSYSKSNRLQAPDSGGGWNIVNMLTNGYVTLDTELKDIYIVHTGEKTYIFDDRQIHLANIYNYGLMSPEHYKKVQADLNVAKKNTASSLEMSKGTYILTPNNGVTTNNMTFKSTTSDPEVCKMDIIIDNRQNGSDYNILFPSGNEYVLCDGMDSLTVKAGKVGEVSVIYAGSTYYIRSIS